VAFGVDFAQALTPRLNLCLADGMFAVQYLALQVGYVDCVAIGQYQCADSGRGQIQGRWRAEPTRANDQRTCRQQALLASNVNLGQEDMSAVAEQLRVIHEMFGRGV
jgi:hypothetical protein